MNPSPGPAAAQPPVLPRVLLVDDNVDALESMNILLQTCGYEVAVAKDGIEALKLAPEFGPTAALVDIGLPGMDGYELARALRRLYPAPVLRLVAFTGYGGPEDAARALAAGFDAHLVKPVDFDKLLVVLHG